MMSSVNIILIVSIILLNRYDAINHWSISSEKTIQPQVQTMCKHFCGYVIEESGILCAPNELNFPIKSHRNECSILDRFHLLFAAAG